MIHLVFGFRILDLSNAIKKVDVNIKELNCATNDKVIIIYSTNIQINEKGFNKLFINKNEKEIHILLNGIIIYTFLKEIQKIPIYTKTPKF